MQWDHTHLKVDQTLLHFGNNYLLISNINIPFAEFHQLDAILDRIQLFIQTDYVGLIANIQYQVCATYELQNIHTGEVRLWTGSFNPRGNLLNVLSPFRQYQATTFKTIVTQACSPNNVYNRLRFYHTTTEWVFSRLTSAIVSVQAQIPPLHSTIERRNLLGGRHGRHTRVHLTFDLA